MDHPSSFALRLFFESQRRAVESQSRLWRAAGEFLNARNDYAATFSDPARELKRMEAFSELQRTGDSYAREVYIQSHQALGVRRALRRSFIIDEHPELQMHEGGWRDPRYDRSKES